MGEPPRPQPLVLFIPRPYSRRKVRRTPFTKSVRRTAPLRGVGRVQTSATPRVRRREENATPAVTKSGEVYESRVTDRTPGEYHYLLRPKFRTPKNHGFCMLLLTLGLQSYLKTSLDPPGSPCPPSQKVTEQDDDQPSNEHTRAP